MPRYRPEDYSIFLAKGGLTKHYGSLDVTRERAAKFQVQDPTPFLAADARSLPFPDSCFGVVFMESVNIFILDKSARSFFKDGTGSLSGDILDYEVFAG